MCYKLYFYITCWKYFHVLGCTTQDCEEVHTVMVVSIHIKINMIEL